MLWWGGIIKSCDLTIQIVILTTMTPNIQIHIWKSTYSYIYSQTHTYMYSQDSTRTNKNKSQLSHVKDLFYLINEIKLEQRSAVANEGERQRWEWGELRFELSTMVVNDGEGLGVCSQPTDPPKPTRPNLTYRDGSVFRAWWVGLGYNIFFDSGSSWVWLIRFQTGLDPPIYLKYI